MSSSSEFRDAARAFRSLASAGLAVPMVEALADRWVDTSQQAAPVDTGQLKARTAVTYVGGTAARAEGRVVSDVPYAGFVNFGTAHVAPRPYFTDGMTAAEELATTFGAPLGAQIARAVESGGVWNPRRVFGM